MTQWTDSGGISPEDAETMLRMLKKMKGDQ
jgi:hypothetical protein